MSTKNPLTCPKCMGIDFEMKKVATYIYSYELDNSFNEAPSLRYEPLPFLFETRDMLSSDEYIQCKNCCCKYIYDFRDNIIKGEFK